MVKKKSRLNNESFIKKTKTKHGSHMCAVTICVSFYHLTSFHLVSFHSILSHVTKHTQGREECNKLKSLLNQCCAPSAETYRSYFSDTQWHDLAEPLCSSTTPISSLFPFGCSQPSEKIQNTASNPLRWLTAQQALYRTTGLTFYGPTVGCYQPEGGRSRSEGQCINQDWNVASVKPHKVPQ